MPTPVQLVARADEYARRRRIVRAGLLGEGKDGAVWHTRHRNDLTGATALKIHQYAASYQSERNAYVRLRDVRLTGVGGFNIPALLDHDDDLLAIEMQIVSPPFVLDFASAQLDADPELIEDPGYTLEDLVRERFGDRADVVLGLRDDLIVRAGVYVSDLHPHNIKFAD